MSPTFNTPVLILIFNRPDKVRKLIGALEKVRPSQLYISADGPRSSHPEDVDKCTEAQRIASDVSWPCEVHTNFSEVNLGVDPAVEKGIDWFFSQVEEGVILEDDCIPHPDFFRFAEEMLSRYRDDTRVMMISGNNFQDGHKRGDGDYYFSRYPSTWGWATWKRAWQLYDTKLTHLPEFIENDKISKIRPHASEQRHWLRYFHKLYTGTSTPWDAKWVFAMWNNAGLSVNPNVALVENIGFGTDATHTKSLPKQAPTSTGWLPPELKHPNAISADESADTYLFNKTFKNTLSKRMGYTWNKIIQLFRRQLVDKIHSLFTI